MRSITSFGELGWRPLSGHVGWRAASRRAYVWSFALALSPLLLVAWLSRRSSILAARRRLRLRTGWRSWPFAARWNGGTRLCARRRSAADSLRAGGAGASVLPFAKGRIQSIDYHREFVSADGSGRRTLQARSCRRAQARTQLIPAIPSATARQLRDELLALPCMSFPVNIERVGDRPAVALAAAAERRPRHGRAGRRAAACARASRATTSQRHREPNIRDFLPDPSCFQRHGQGRAAARRRGPEAARRSRSSATMTSTARPARRCWCCCCAGSAPSRWSTSPTG